ncbi:MAG: TadE-like protein [Actinomycetota bacterium]|jgi:Flp pilus assembly protein TadG
MRRFVAWARSRGDRGTALVEMAFVAPLLILFLIGTLQVGLVVIGNAAASNAAREGARAASIRYECADGNSGSQCTATPTTNFAFIQGKVLAKLNGLVKTNTVVVSVKCRQNSDTGPIVNCDRTSVHPDFDIVEVTVQYRHIGATPFVADNLHTSIARSVILGSPVLS